MCRAFVGQSWFHDLSEEYRRLSVVANYFENLGLLVKTGILDAGIVCELYCSVISDCWDAFGPIVAQRRAVLDLPSLWENFEYVAALSQEWLERHPNGNYPQGVRRSTFPLWAETRERVSR